MQAIRDAILYSSGELARDPLRGSPVTKLGEINIGREATKIATLNKPNHFGEYHPIIIMVCQTP